MIDREKAERFVGRMQALYEEFGIYIYLGHDGGELSDGPFKGYEITEWQGDYSIQERR